MQNLEIMPRNTKCSSGIIIYEVACFSNFSLCSKSQQNRDECSCTKFVIKKSYAQLNLDLHKKTDKFWKQIR